jgi:hypothetical protein
MVDDSDTPNEAAIAAVHGIELSDAGLEAE